MEWVWIQVMLSVLHGYADDGGERTIRSVPPLTGNIGVVQNLSNEGHGVELIHAVHTDGPGCNCPRQN